MKIQDIHCSVVKSLEDYAKLHPSALIYTKSSHEGDFTIHQSRLQFKQNCNSNDIVQNFKSEYISKVILKGKAFVFYANHKKYLKNLLTNIVTLKDDYGKEEKKNKLILVEYSSPNIAKKFHAGHLRTTVLGSFVRNLLLSLGYDVYSINYLGDWGKQFGLIGVGYKKYGCDKLLKEDAIKHLFDVYVKICKDAESDKNVDDQARQWFKDLENGDEENNKMYRMCREMSIEKYKELYAVLNCHFDEFSGESFYANKAKDIIERLMKTEVSSKNDSENDPSADFDEILDSMDVKRGVYDIQKPLKTMKSKGNEKEGEILDTNKSDISNSIVKQDKDGSKYIETSYGNVCVIKQDGATLYSSRDIAACEDRVHRLKPDGIIYVVASQQDLYFKQLFEIFKKTKFNKKTAFQHINFGLVDGMSTRRGTVVFLEDIINEARETMLEKMNENTAKSELIENKDATCEILAASAIIVQDFGAKRIKNYTFDMERNTSTTGFTGPYLQYLHCRLVSIEKRNAEKTAILDELIENNKFFSEFSEDDFDDKMIASFVNLSKYNLILQRCVSNYEPSTLLSYLMDTAKTLHNLIRDYKVLGEENKTAIPRLMFYRANRIVLANGMRLLGLKPLSRM